MCSANPSNAFAPSPLNVGPCISAIVVGFSAASLRKVGTAICVDGMNGRRSATARAGATVSLSVVGSAGPVWVKRSLLNSVPVVSS